MAIFHLMQTVLNWGLPSDSNKTSKSKFARLHLDYLIQEFKAGVNVNEVAFAFDDDTSDVLRHIGFTEKSSKPYWIEVLASKEREYFQTVEELFDTPRYNGKSLKECWSDVVILNIAGYSFEDWLTYVDHSVATHVYESEEDDRLYINGIELNGFIDEDSICTNCSSNQCYADGYDAYFCPCCNSWLTEDWWDEDEEYCDKRPLEPELLWKPYNLLPFAQVQYCLEGRSYTYYCPDKDIAEGDWVIVPVGKNNVEKEAQVTQLFKSPANEPPFPLDKIKTILRKSLDFTRELAETVKMLCKDDAICDVSNGKVSVDSLVAYDILKTPIGNFWLELNCHPIKITVRAHYPSKEDQYFVEGSFFIRPYQSEFDVFEELKICTDIELRKSRLICTSIWTFNLSCSIGCETGLKAI